MPKLSAIIPTRERSDTLPHALRTLLVQDYQDCEIIVSDNASQDNTREIVASFSDPRLRYINTGRRVGMSENWEFALGHATGEFITFIGDDDGYMPGAFTRAMGLLQETGMSALAWEKASYFWPNHPVKVLRNQLSLRVGSGQIYTVESPRRLAKLLQFRDGWAYTRLPGVYHGIARRSLIEKVRQSSPGGVFFNSIAPDVFSAMVIAMVLDRYLLAEYSFSVGGQSQHSTGGSFAIGKAADMESPAAKFKSELTREYDPRVLVGPAVESLVMGEYLLAQRALPGFKFPEPPWGRYVRGLLRRAKITPSSEAILESATHTVKMLGLKIKVPSGVKSPATDWPAPGMRGDMLSFNAPPEVVSNIYDACQIVAAMTQQPVRGDARSSLKRFGANLRQCFISEAKTLYRSV